MLWGMSYVGWAFVGWIGLTSTLGAIIVYRVLITHHEEDEKFMQAEEIERARAHVRHVTRMVRWFGIVSAVWLVSLIIAAFIHYS